MEFAASVTLAAVAGLSGMIVGCGSATRPAMDSVGDDHEAKIQLLEEFAATWNRHDTDALMSMITEDCARPLPIGGLVLKVVLFWRRSTGPDSLASGRGDLLPPSGPLLGRQRGGKPVVRQPVSVLVGI